MPTEKSDYLIEKPFEGTDVSAPNKKEKTEKPEVEVNSVKDMLDKISVEIKEETPTSIEITGIVRPKKEISPAKLVPK